MQIPHFSKATLSEALNSGIFTVAVPAATSGDCSSRMNKFNNALIKKVSFGKSRDIAPSVAKENPPIAR